MTEHNTWLWRDTKFLFEIMLKKILHQDRKFQISKWSCNVLFMMYALMKYHTISL